MNKQNSGGAYQRLGGQLKTLRTRCGESLAEVSGAVEIEISELANFELGRTRPSEDILLLLISHFGAQDDEALKLWEAAGYGTAKSQTEPVTASTAPTPDNRVLFTDVVDVIVNNFGVVMNFMQSGGPNMPPTNVARVGMSREHAKSVLEILKVTLAQTERPGRNMPRLANTEPSDINDKV